MATKPKALLSWSSGKDSAWALHVARARGELEIVGLLTTITAAFGRVSMHGVREEVLAAQAASVGLPLTRVAIPSPCTNEDYARLMSEAMRSARASGVERIVFGDLFLEDVRRYREENLARVGMTAEFPLWGRATRELAHEMIDSGLRAIVTCVDPKQLPSSFAGRTFDHDLLRDLPAGVDPCGENGELHTCVVAGPMLTRPLDVTVGAVVERDGFTFADVVLRS